MQYLSFRYNLIRIGNTSNCTLYISYYCKLSYIDYFVCRNDSVRIDSVQNDSYPLSVSIVIIHITLGF